MINKAYLLKIYQIININIAIKNIYDKEKEYCGKVRYYKTINIILLWEEYI